MKLSNHNIKSHFPYFIKINYSNLCLSSPTLMFVCVLTDINGGNFSCETAISLLVKITFRSSFDVPHRPFWIHAYKLAEWCSFLRSMWLLEERLPPPRLVVFKQEKFQGVYWGEIDGVSLLTQDFSCSVAMFGIVLCEIFHY